ncbi:DUF3052 family protein [Sphingomonas sp. DT-207]|uniref:DUF3052 family protein n=1 Tax=Sphingomonas sp. DT-207 TaxID=3396167 RepID=UPI003F19A3B6
MTEGSSGTQLAERIGLKRGIRCWFHNMPEHIRRAVDPEARGVEEERAATEGLQCVWLFGTERARIEHELAALRQLIAPNGFIWVSWPGTAGAETDLDEATVRELAGSAGLAASHSCSVDEHWNALKLIFPNQLR